MDLISSISKIFALVYQEDNQRKISMTSDASGTTGFMAFYAQIDAK